MAETSSVYVLDSFAMLAYFQAEPGGPIVRDLVQAARDQTGTLFMSMINVGEMFYIAFRRRGLQRAEEMLVDLRALPITVCAATDREGLGCCPHQSGVHPILCGCLRRCPDSGTRSHPGYW